jgi:Mn-dependent DtxR family transcriptional regulator
MSESNILLKITLEKNRMIKEFIEDFLGHQPSVEEKKEFKIMHSLSESAIYHKGKFIGKVSFDTDEGPVI